ncbi:MAG TPA: LacI family DNA-binding transcriptional regulator [Actinomycetota bacterium]
MTGTRTRRSAKRRGHATILDVAEHAGVSKSLVSLVMRGSPQVSDERRRAVLRAADALGYRPNAVARSLVRKRSAMIGVILSDLHNPFFAEVVDGIEEEALAADYHALFSTGGRRADGESVAIEKLLQLRTDGLILASIVLPAREILAAAATAPVVLVARPSRWREVDSVTNDDRAGAKLAVEHLVALGHRSIAHIDGGRGAGAASRRTGYLEAMRRHGLAGSSTVAGGDYTEEGGARGVAALLRGNVPTAIFVANDLAAVGALQALAEHGLRVPDDVSLVGYDNTALAALGHINLTTVDQPRRDMGATAVRLLLERLDEGRSRARHLVVAPNLVVRGTTGPPPGSRSGGRAGREAAP